MYKVQITETFERWFESLRDTHAQRRIQARIDRAESGSLGDHKHLRGGVSEMRIHYGGGYRLYCTERADRLIIVLAGGDKTSQVQDIKLAQKLVLDLEE